MRLPFWLLLILLIVWLLGMSYCHNSLCNCGPVGAVVPAAVTGGAATSSLKYLSIADSDGAYTASLNDNLLFNQSDCMYTSPISDSLNTYFQGLADYLTQNDSRILVLTGLYQDSESNNCPAENLGLARAESVQQLLVDQGAPAEQIRLSSDNQNILDVADDKIMGGIAYSFLSGDIDEVENRLEFAKALVVGHTDDEGSSSSNRRLSKDRANTVRDFMISKGIYENQIVTQGMGPDEPVATNDTADGRAQNRRVEISIE